MTTTKIRYAVVVHSRSGGSYTIKVAGKPSSTGTGGRVCNTIAGSLKSGFGTYEAAVAWGSENGLVMF